MIPLHDTGKIVMKFAIKLAFIGWAGLIGFAAQPASASDYTLEEVVILMPRLTTACPRK